MKIGIDIRTLGEGKFTGVEVYTSSLLKNLIDNQPNHDYRLFFNSYSQRLPELDFFTENNVEIFGYQLPNRLLNFSFQLLGYPKIDRLLGGVDVFFSPRYLFSAVSSNCPSVITVHDLSFIHYPEFFSIKQRLWHLFISDKSACRRASRIITVSQSTKTDLMELFQIPPEKISVIYPGLDHSQFHPNKNSNQAEILKKTYLLPEEYILYLGTIEPRKNILAVIEGYEMLRKNSPHKPSLVLAGALGWLYDKILKKIKTSAYQNDIKLLRFVPEMLKAELYRGAKVFIFPSFFEGFGFPPLEAMACGTPVIAAYNSSFPEVLGQACLYINPYDAGQIYQALHSIIAEPALARTLAEKGKAQAKKFDWASASKATFEVLWQAAKEK